MSTGIWSCKIGIGTDLPPGCDAPMRRAVAQAYREITGKEPEFLFSGWNGELDVFERRYIDDKRQRDGEV